MDTDTWDQVKGRPQAVRAHREELLEATSDAVAEAMPGPDASTYEYRQFLNSHAGVVTRQINDDESGSDPHDEHDETEVTT
jgi:hypothetical protein